MKKEVQLKSDERIDDLKRNGYRIIQNKNGFCFGMDAVLLSGFAKAKKGEIVVDLGSGTGIIPILMEAKTEGEKFLGIEIQAAMAEMACRSVKLNGLEKKVEIIRGDLREIFAENTNSGKNAKTCKSIAPYDNNNTGKNATSGENAKTGENTTSLYNTNTGRNESCLENLKSSEGTDLIECHDPGITRLKKLSGKVNVVTSNPPYIKVGFGLKNPDEPLAIARHEIKCKLSDVCQAASSLLSLGGRFYMVHRPKRMAEIIETLRKYRLEPKRIKPVYPFIDRESNMILIEAIKDAKEECRLEKPIIIYEETGKYTREIYEIYGY